AIEIAYWRTFARSLMPRTSMADSRSTFDTTGERDRQNALLAVGAWEHLLLLDPNDNEALLNLGVTFVSLTYLRILNPPFLEADVATARKGTQLVEAAFLANPSPFNAATYTQMINPIEHRIPDRALAMYEFILAHAKQFPQWGVKPARLFIIAKNPDRLAGEIE